MNSLNNETYWEAFVNALPEAVLILNMSGAILYANKYACQLFEKSPADIINEMFSYPIQSDAVIEIEIIKNNMKLVYADLTMKLGKWKDSDAWIAVIHDTTEKKLIENKLMISANVFNFAKEGILIADQDGNIVDINQEFTVITGYEKPDVIGKNPKILQSGRYNKNFYQEMWNSIKKNGYWQGEIWNKKKSGDLYPQLLAISEVKDDADNVINYVGVFYDITTQEEQTRQLERVAHYDLLTGLPNRALFVLKLEEAIKHPIDSKLEIAIIFIDLDDFKQINDAYGHEIGDLLLVKFSKIVEKHTRESDTFARYGGDEFIFLMGGIKSKNDSDVFIKRIYDELNNPIIIKKHEIFIKVSMGVTFYPQEGHVLPEQLIRQADLAMYESKISGKNKITKFNIKNEIVTKQENELINELTDALHNDHLKLYYQPKVNMETNTIFGVEGLIRWEHPKHGLLLPDKFIPRIRSHSEFLLKLTQWTITQSLKQLKDWSRLSKELTISINIDAFQLEQAYFIDELQEMLKPYDKDTYKRLEFEILESSIISNLDGVHNIIQRCKKIGIEFMLDDFGTGYSSINYLTSLPFKYVKIDMQFIKNILNNKKDIAILKAMLDIAKAVDISVIAEGVETEAHKNLLLELGCYLGQGFVFNKALPPNQFESWFLTWKAEHQS